MLDVLALPQDQRQPLIKVATANPYIRAFSRLFDYAIQEQLFDGQHPATNLRLGGGGHSADDREPFKPDDLKRIFNAPIYRGCLNDGDGYAIAGLDKPRRSRFWVPLIALFTGTRLGEICQLRENDFTVIDGIDVFLLRHERMDLKTAASARPVPVHPELKRIGLLRFVEQRRRDAGTGALIFPEITVGSNGYASENYSKWFRRFLISVGAKRAATSFHSFRHSFADAGIDAGLMREEIDWIGGWANKTTSQKYGGSVETKTRKLAPLINRIAYRGLDLSHLHEAVGGQE